VYLRPFDPAKPIRGASDASDFAYGGCLEQEYDDGWFPFLVYSHKFKDGEKGWDVPDKEMYAIYHAFHRYRSFLAQPAHTVKWFTDHRNLAKFLFSTNLLKSHDGRLGRWYEVISQCNLEIQYLPGSENLIPDFLSRYGYPASIDHTPRVLLPLTRFSTKAQVDIKRWFKQHATDKNIREILEKQFASVPDELPAARRVRFVPSPTVIPAPATPGVKNNGSGSQIPIPSAPTNASVKAASGCRTPLPRERIVPDSLSPRQSRLAAALGLASYVGTKLDSCLPSPTACRVGKDWSGLGALR